MVRQYYEKLSGLIGALNIVNEIGLPMEVRYFFPVRAFMSTKAFVFHGRLWAWPSSYPKASPQSC